MYFFPPSLIIFGIFILSFKNQFQTIVQLLPNDQKMQFEQFGDDDTLHGNLFR